MTRTLVKTVSAKGYHGAQFTIAIYRVVWAVALMVAVLAGPARAATWNLSQTTATPVQVFQIWAQWDQYWIHFCPSFINQSPETITAVQFGYWIVDAFGDATGEPMKADIEGTFSPNVQINGPTSMVDFEDTNMFTYNATMKQAQYCTRSLRPNGSMDQFIVKTMAVRFADGTVWKLGNPWKPGQWPG